MKHLKSLSFLVFASILASCGNNAFLKQKYTKLKSPSPSKLENEQIEKEVSDQNEVYIYDQTDYKESNSQPTSFQTQEQVSDSSPQILENDSYPPTTNQVEEIDQEIDRTVLKHSNKRDKKKKSKNATSRFLIVLFLILAYACMLSAVVIYVELGLELSFFLISLFLVLLAAVWGALAILQALKISKDRESRKDTILMYFGFIAGGLFALSGTLYAFYFLIEFLFL